MIILSFRTVLLIILFKKGKHLSFHAILLVYNHIALSLNPWAFQKILISNISLINLNIN